MSSTSTATGSASSSSSSNDGATSTSNRRDPAGLLNIDESGRPISQGQGDAPTVVKIKGTARDDLNGLLGFCTSYNQDRERYMIRMATVDPANAPNVTVMALKAQNIEKASTLESYRAQFQQLFTDPRIRQKMRYYYETASNKVKPMKIEYVAGGVLSFSTLLLYFLGFTKSLMMISALLMIGLILQKDIQQKSGWKAMGRNFPGRSKVVLEKQFPFLTGKLNDQVAAGIVGVLLALTIQSVFFTSSGGNSTGAATTMTNNVSVTRPISSTFSAPPSASVIAMNREQFEKYYNIGFQDSVDGNDRGHSLSKELQRLLEEEAKQEDLEPIPEIPYSQQQQPRPQAQSKPFMTKLLSLRTMGSLYYFYRTGTTLGVDQSTGIFSMAQLCANIQHNIPIWQKGMMAFSLFNLVSNLFF